MLFSNKKGQLLNNFKTQIAALVFAVLLIGALVLALNEFQDDMGSDLACADDATLNSTSGECCGSATYSGNCTVTGSYSSAYNTTQEGLEGGSNASGFLSTIGTLIGVSALIAIVVGAFMFARR